MVSHAVWKNMALGPQLRQKPRPSASVFVYWVHRAMFFTRHGRPWSNPTLYHNVLDILIIYIDIYIYISFAHYATSLSSLCRHIWNCKMHVRYIESSVCLRLSQFFQLSLTQYMGLCLFSLPVYHIMIVRICVPYLLFIINSEVWPICQC